MTLPLGLATFQPVPCPSIPRSFWGLKPFFPASWQAICAFTTPTTRWMGSSCACRIRTGTLTHPKIKHWDHMNTRNHKSRQLASIIHPLSLSGYMLICLTLRNHRCSYSHKVLRFAIKWPSSQSHPIAGPFGCWHQTNQLLWHLLCPWGHNGHHSLSLFRILPFPGRWPFQSLKIFMSRATFRF